ncbi:MAG: hypothetical protein RIQ33_1229 [Bacteroidota bacterium]
MKQKVFFTILFCVSTTLFLTATYAQCPMCGEAARTSLKEGNNTAISLNAGILYLLLGPYVLLMAGGVMWYRHRRRFKKMQALNNS